MVPRIRKTISSFTIVFLFASAGTLRAQHPSEVPAAPLPGQILSAKKVFIANASGQELDPRNFFSKAFYPDRAYNQFYAALKADGPYELVSTPADADLVLEIRFAYFAIFNTNSPGPDLKLAILDPKSNVLLWALAEPVKAGSGPHSAEKCESNFNTSMTALVKDLKKLASPGSVETANPQ